MADVVFVHGWAGRPEIWRPVISMLPKHLDIRFGGGSYFNKILVESAQVIVSHSFGLNYIFSHCNHDSKILLLSPLHNYQHIPESLQYSYAIRAMKQKLLTEPALLMSEFYRRAGWTSSSRVPLSNMDQELLLNDLEKMIGDEPISIPRGEGEIWWAEDDQILPLSAVKKVENVTKWPLRILNSGTHMLMLTHTEEISNFVIQSLEKAS